jgi:hypothetical protein
VEDPVAAGRYVQRPSQLRLRDPGLGLNHSCGNLPNASSFFLHMG